MLFNSYIFLFVFLPASVAGFYALGKWKQSASTAWLILISLFFYGWWNPRYLLLLGISIVSNYLFGIGINRARTAGALARSRSLLAAGVVSDLGLLAYYKYAAFLLDTVGAVTHVAVPEFHIILPLAISFFTFTQIAYLVDAYHGATTEYDFWHYTLFVTFFPHLIAGPIVSYRRIGPQLAAASIFRFRTANFSAGFTMFVLGLAKKVLIADNLSPLSQYLYDHLAPSGNVTMLTALAGTLSYALQIYFDFSGYSDMAIGLARIFNIRFPQNFNSPYKSASITEFWRRWHMTLSTFLRDHLYIPLGGNRKGNLRTQLNLMATMFLGGLWHGAGWNFAIWGSLHGIYLIIHRAWQPVVKRFPILCAAPFRIGGNILTLVAVCIAWIFFRAHTLSQSVSIIKAIAGQHGVGIPLGLQSPLEHHHVHLPSWFAAWSGVDLPYSFGAMLIAAAIALLAPNTEELMRLADPLKASSSMHLPLRLWHTSPAWAVSIGLLLSLSVLGMTRLTEFLYFQF